MNCRLSVLAAAITLSCGTAAARQPEFSIQLNPLSSYAGSGQGTPGTGIEIVAYDRASRRVFAINAGKNTLDVVDLADPASPSRVATIDFAPYGGGVNGVAVHDGLVAVASEAMSKTDPGRIVFLDATSLGGARPGARGRTARHGDVYAGRSLPARGQRRRAQRGLLRRSARARSP